MYECPRCVYVCTNMGDLIKHLSKKKKCEPTKLNIATEDIIVENCKKKGSIEENGEYCKTCFKKKTPEELYYMILQLKINQRTTND
jgi:hypothetical protein